MGVPGSVVSSIHRHAGYAFAVRQQLVSGRAIDLGQASVPAFAVIAAVCLVGAMTILPVKKRP